MFFQRFSLSQEHGTSTTAFYLQSSTPASTDWEQPTIVAYNNMVLVANNHRVCCEQQIDAHLWCAVQTKTVQWY